MRNKLLVVSFSLFAFIITACSTSSAAEPEPVGDPDRGRQIFEDTKRVRCIACHSLDSNVFRAGPVLKGISERAGERDPDLSAVEYLQQSILEPSAYIVEGFDDKMKAFQIVDPD